MIQVTLSNEILRRISAIDENRFSMNAAKLPPVTANRLRKNSKKKSAYASNRIEGNPLTESQADTAIEKDAHKHFLKPEQEIRNYFMALEVLEQKCKQKEPLSMALILQIQALVKKGASKKKIGLRGARCCRGCCLLSMMRKAARQNISRRIIRKFRRCWKNWYIMSIRPMITRCLLQRWYIISWSRSTRSRMGTAERQGFCRDIYWI